MNACFDNVDTHYHLSMGQEDALLAGGEIADALTEGDPTSATGICLIARSGRKCERMGRC
jgi:hypothetical protein